MPYGVEGWPQFSRYQPLDQERKEIRLLRLDPCRSSNNLDFSLVHHPLGDHVRSDRRYEYFALSYVWGNATDAKPIYLDGEIVEIRATLWRALDALRHQLRGRPCDDAPFRGPAGVPMESLYIWIDFLCINQDDVDERNSQIQMMDQVFSKAQGVIGWLGDPTDESNAAMDLLHDALVADDFPQGPKDQYQGERRKEIDGALSVLVSFEYWRRVWIIQEVALSQAAFWMFCGDRRLSWEQYSSLFGKRENGSTDLPARLDTEDRRVAMTKARLFRSLTGANLHKAPLHDLMAMARGYLVSDPRDRVYGLLGIVEPSDRSLLDIDYRKPWLQVFTDASLLFWVPNTAEQFFHKMLSLCDGYPGVCEAQRLTLHEGLSIPPVQIDTRFGGILTDFGLRAVLHDIGGSTELRTSTGQPRKEGHRSERCYLYDCQADVLPYSGVKNGEIQTRVGVSHATAKLQVGDVLLKVIDPWRAEIVMRRDANVGLRVVGVTARHHLPKLGSLGSSGEWLRDLKVLDPSRWCRERLEGEALRIMNEQAALASIERACSKYDFRVWNDTRTTIEFNTQAIVNFLQEELWFHYNFEKRGWSKSVDDWLSNTKSSE